MYDTIAVAKNETFWAGVDTPLASTGSTLNPRFLRVLLWIMDLAMDCLGDESGIVDSIDESLNRHLKRYGLEYVRVERLG